MCIGETPRIIRAPFRLSTRGSSSLPPPSSRSGISYRTVFVIVPDCGRDANPLMSVPFQHHFNSRSAHEIFALLWGPGIDKGRVLDKHVDQTSLAATIGAIMGFKANAEGRVLSEILA